MKWAWGLLVVLGLSGCAGFTERFKAEMERQQKMELAKEERKAPLDFWGHTYKQTLDFVYEVKQKARQLKPGMTEKEIVVLLGEMKGVGPVLVGAVYHGPLGERYTWGYALEDPFRGGLEYPVQLQMENGRLLSWVTQ